MAIALCFVLLLCSFALPASAAVLDYNDYITNIQVDGDNDLVSVSFPIDGALFRLEDATTSTRYDYQGTSFTHYFDTTHRYRLFLYPIYPHSIDYSNIPNDTQTTIHLTTSANGMYVDVGRLNVRCWFNMYGDHYSDGVLFSAPEFFDLYYSFNFTKPSGATSGNFYYDFDPLYVSNVNGDSQEFTITLKSFEMTFSISSLYRLQQQSGKTNVILKEVEKQLADQGKTLDEVLQQQQQTNDKLDGIQGGINDTNNKLETLPGQIGDEMQGVIDNEKEESKGEGNKFVDQILDALPDPSQDVLAALEGLTDATAYTGTDAVLPIPAIVLPGIDGLFPETEIWGGTEFDIGSYVQLLPPTLLTLVQSLFTIAIVLFCVYELKGIISYCLTLRENKGG